MILSKLICNFFLPNYTSLLLVGIRLYTRVVFWSLSWDKQKDLRAKGCQLLSDLRCEPSALAMDPTTSLLAVGLGQDVHVFNTATAELFVRLEGE